MEPQILVVMPTYHGPATWVQRAIASVQKQTNTNFECWIIKDGCKHGLNIMCENCTDRMRYLHNFVKTDRRFKLFQMAVHHGNGGSGVRNFALINSDHEYIAYLDDDNWWEPNHLDAVYDAITLKDVGFAYTGTTVYDLAGVKKSQRLAITPAHGFIDTSELIHRRVLTEIAYWGDKQPVDWMLVQKWINAGATWAHTGIHTLHYMHRGVPVCAPRE